MDVVFGMLLLHTMYGVFFLFGGWVGRTRPTLVVTLTVIFLWPWMVVMLMNARLSQDEEDWS